MIKTGTQASPFKPKMRVRQFERPGNFRDAFKTFKSVRPTDVKRFSQNGVSLYIVFTINYSNIVTLYHT